MNRQPQLLIDITSAALKKPGAALWMRQAAELAQKFDSVIGIQVHNSAAPEDLALAKNSGFPLSFHAPVAGEYMMNLAAEDASTSWQMIDDQARLMELYQVKTAVFHAALMTDKPIRAFGHGMSYQDCMSQANRPELLRHDSSMFIVDYTNSDEYAMRLDRLKHNLSELRRKYPQFCWCVENDFPGFVAGVLRGGDLADLDHETCFDTGHMWAASKMLDLDFYEEMLRAMNSGRVKMIHLHASRYTFDMPHAKWGDGHLPLNHPTTMDIPRIIRACKDNHVRHIVLEIADASLEDVKTVLRYYFEDQLL